MFPADPVRDTPQSLNQMIRMTMWMLAEIEDEIRGLIIAKSMEEHDWKGRKSAFIRKWGDKIQVYPCIEVELSHKEITKETKAESYLDRSLTPSQFPWMAVIPYWDVLYRSFRESSTVREVVDGKAKYDFDLNTIQGVLHTTPGPTLQRQGGERCVRNVELVLRVLSSFEYEILEELTRRKECKHSRSHKYHHSTIKTLKKALPYLRRMIQRIHGIAMEIRGMHIRPFGVTDEDFRILLDWGSLDGNSYRQLIPLTSDELVSRLVERPIPEDAVFEKDELVTGIMRGLLETRTEAMIALREDEVEKKDREEHAEPRNNRRDIFTSFRPKQGHFEARSTCGRKCHMQSGVETTGPKKLI